MKRLFFSCLLLVFIMFSFSECNRDGASDQQNTNDTTGTVNSMAYMPFVNGMKLTYTITQGEEQGNSSVLKVTGLKDSSGYTVANFITNVSGMDISSSGMFNQKNTILTSNAPAIYNQMLDSLRKTFNRNFTHQEKPFVIVIPHQNQAGTTVFNDITTGQIHGENYDADLHEQLIEDYSIIIQKGTIDSVATLTTAKGDIHNCVRIRYTMTTTFSYNAVGDDGNYSGTDKIELDKTEWFAPGLGMIKSKEINRKTGAVSITELTQVE